VTPVELFKRIVKIELVCRDQDAERYAAIIADHAKTGEPGDGAIFLSTVDRALQIRTGRTGDATL
jgi:nitrogen regulatory protein P-II 1